VKVLEAKEGFTRIMIDSWQGLGASGWVQTTASSR